MTDELRRTWGASIRGIRVAHGMTQGTLAEQVGVTKATVSRWEAGLIAPRDAMKVAIAEALNVDVRVLFPLVRAR